MKYFRRSGAVIKRLVMGLANLVGRFAAQFDARDVFLIVGLLLVAYGLTSVWLPAAFIVPGAVLIYVALGEASA